MEAPRARYRPIVSMVLYCIAQWSPRVLHTARHLEHHWESSDEFTGISQLFLSVHMYRGFYSLARSSTRFRSDQEFLNLMFPFATEAVVTLPFNLCANLALLSWDKAFWVQFMERRPDYEAFERLALDEQLQVSRLSPWTHQLVMVHFSNSKPHNASECWRLTRATRARWVCSLIAEWERMAARESHRIGYPVRL